VRSHSDAIELSDDRVQILMRCHCALCRWNRWHCWVDERLLKQTADLMVKLGLTAAGYRFLNIVRPARRYPVAMSLLTALMMICAQDDCWQSQRALDRHGVHNGSIQVRFPSTTGVYFELECISTRHGGGS
jgi:hypothetical protein